MTQTAEERHLFNATDLPALEALCAAGQELAALGMLPATSGNLSLRLPGGRILMTRSGREKGSLTAADLMVTRLEDPAPPGASAEAPLHLGLYRDDSEIGCVLHVHSRPAAVLSRHCLPEGALRLQGWELQKALAGQHTHEATVVVPVFENDQDTAALATLVSARLAEIAAVPAYLLAGHGLYAWGKDLAQARRHVIALDVLLQSELDLRSLR